jgi:hypothetical protein
LSRGRIACQALAVIAAAIAIVVHVRDFLDVVVPKAEHHVGIHRNEAVQMMLVMNSVEIYGSVSAEHWIDAVNPAQFHRLKWFRAKDSLGAKVFTQELLFFTTEVGRCWRCLS